MGHGMSLLQQFVDNAIVSTKFQWAWDNYKSVVLELQRQFGCKALMEVGGGRSPLIDEREYSSLNIKYTVNDISAAELELAPEWSRKACFDISSPPPNSASSFDLIFSKMVFEHVPDAKAAYQAVYHLLAPNGICLSFFPTLYCLPFVANYLSPEKLSIKFQRKLDPRANPKFPAYYNWCRSTPSLQRRLKAVGFREVIISPFYGHNYYRSIPFIHSIGQQWTEIVRERDLRRLSSFAYAFMQK
jgi:SAM-dependent methyltransferase